MRVKEYMYDAHSPLNRAAKMKEEGTSCNRVYSCHRLLIANTVIKGCQWGDHRGRTTAELSQLPFRAMEIL